jgi:hypothetical protein
MREGSGLPLTEGIPEVKVFSKEEKYWSSMDAGGRDKSVGGGFRHFFWQILPQSSRCPVDQESRGLCSASQVYPRIRGFSEAVIKIKLRVTPTCSRMGTMTTVIHCQADLTI